VQKRHEDVPSGLASAGAAAGLLHLASDVELQAGTKTSIHVVVCVFGVSTLCLCVCVFGGYNSLTIILIMD